MPPPDELPPVPTDEPILDTPEPEPGGLGEFTETIIDEDGEVEPEVLEEPDDNEAR
jgi:hypothetical protein